MYLNPIGQPGVSGSLYSIKDYYTLNPALLFDGSAGVRLERIRPVIRSMLDSGLHPMIDLVINHTAIDSPLVEEHPEWFIWNEQGHIQNPFAVDPDNPHKKTVWRDLAEIDNQASSKREELWDYWMDLVDFYIELGFEGFRCDAAYKVPSELWQFLIDRVHQRHPDIVFWAENLGCMIEQTRALRDAGFSFFCNSSKWWNFEDAWCLDQHREFEELPSISFPETHDTERLAKESGGNEAIQRQRYAFAATFSAGVMLPIGYEFGFKKRLHVVETCPHDWESNQFDLRTFIRAVNQFKVETPLFHGEGRLTRINMDVSHLLVLERCSDSAPGKRGWIVMNRHEVLSQVLSRDTLPISEEDFRLVRLSMLDQFRGQEVLDEQVELKPSEVVVVLDNRSL